MNNKTPRRTQSSLTIALAAIFAALVFVVSSQIPAIPIPATSGYFNMGETTIYVAALLFGPFVGALIRRNRRHALSDVYLGFGVIRTRHISYQRNRRLNRRFPKHRNSENTSKTSPYAPSSQS